MKLKFKRQDNQASGQRRPPDRLSDNKKNIIHLHEVALPENQSKQKLKASSLLRSDQSGPVKKKEDVVKKLFEGIVYYANQNNFAKAEQLRERLIDEAPRAVKAIVRSGEIIDQKKVACMDPQKIKALADLFNEFTTSEAAAFYFALKDFVVRPNQPVFQQGSCDNRMYFIRSGSLKLKYFDYDVRKNVSITTLRKGDIAGVETFFTLTNHTTNLIAAEKSEISYLEKSAYQKILADHHAIESKQVNYQPKKPEELSRRAHKRYKAELTIFVQRFDQNGKLSEKLSEAKIMDISAGGLGYRVKNMKIGEAAHLHNSRIFITASYQKYSLSHELRQSAKVVSLKFLPLGECSVHVQFEEPISEDKVIDIAQTADITAYI